MSNYCGPVIEWQPVQYLTSPSPSHRLQTRHDLEVVKKMDKCCYISSSAECSLCSNFNVEKICLTFAYSSPCLFHTAGFTTFSFTYICFTYCCLIQISWWDWIGSFTNLPQLIYKRDHGTVAGTAVISFQLEILVWTVWVLVGRKVTHNWIFQFNFVCSLLGSTDVNRHIYTHIHIQWYEKRLHGSPVKSKLDPNDSVACRTSYSTNNLK